MKVAQDAISQILTDLHICTVDKNILETAVALNFQDFELLLSEYLFTL